ncbi:MAG: class I SAM-dependent methyltransferase [Phycisphaeraceae bacterium]|nr:class I SAM-dependent methyltransferase [Phycisphaeraceae bacterium]
MKCRHCQSGLELLLIDLGSAPPSNAYLTEATLGRPETWYPLRVLVCESCWLVQTEDVAEADALFDADYAYFSGYSSVWLSHCEDYCNDMIDRFKLGSSSSVVEVAANDGSLLKYFDQAGVSCLGVEPTSSTASSARDKGLTIIEAFFGVALAERIARDHGHADLITANNVLAHVPDINDFVAGFAALLKPSGVATFEFPHLRQLIDLNQFDTIYHEHFSYLSVSAAARIFYANGLSIFDVAPLPTHGGSLRVFAQRVDTGTHKATACLDEHLAVERSIGIESPDYYQGFQDRVDHIKDQLLDYLRQAKTAGRTVAAYGAAAKGNTLLNYAGVQPDLLCCVADRNPVKQGKFLPGSRVPIVSPEQLQAAQPDDVLILPWNIKNEVIDQLRSILRPGTRMLTMIPKLEVQTL